MTVESQVNFGLEKKEKPDRQGSQVWFEKKKKKEHLRRQLFNVKNATSTACIIGDTFLKVDGPI